MTKLEALIRTKQAAMDYADKERVIDTVTDAGKGVLIGPALMKLMDMAHVWARKPDKRTYAAAALLGGVLGGVHGFGKNPPREERVAWLKSLMDDE